MSEITPDPLENGGIATYAQDLRSGETSATAVTRDFLDRIERLNPKLDAYQYVADEQAMAQAEAIDKHLAAGTDLGPLMGVPVAIKDIVAVDGMPTTNGSYYAPSIEVTGPEGTYVHRLKQAGCIILGKTKTVEFALGATGVNEARGTPWNPWDSHAHRTPGGSSSGSAVATASGLAAFGLGSDTGGSVRIPAAFNGLFGHKTSIGLLPTDGVFPLCPTLDTLGPLCRSAADAAIVHGVTARTDIASKAPLKGLRVGRPTNYFFDDLDQEVEQCVEAAIDLLVDEGVEIIDVEVPDPSEREWVFPAICPPEFIACLGGPEAFEAARAKMDPTTAARAALGLDVTAVEHVRAQLRYRQLQTIVAEAFEGFDAWVTPTAPFVPLDIATFDDPEVFQRAMQASRNTQPGNIWGICGITMPVHQFGSALPVGLQVMCPAGADTKALSIGLAFEEVFGEPSYPELNRFLL
ncbi:MAG: amidase [Rhodospirillaceae bacterium]|nr:amidase [Rhodospirillaceae bacterium]